MYDIAAVTSGVPLRQYCTSPDVMARAQLSLHERVGHDLICVGSDNFYIAEGFGCETTRDEGELPSLRQPAVKSLADVFEVQVPDPLTRALGRSSGT